MPRFVRTIVVSAAIAAGVLAAAPSAAAHPLKACPQGNACVVIGLHEYRFYRYGSYAVHWIGTGTLQDNLPGSARLFGNTGTRISCIRSGRIATVNWTPVWRIDLSSLPC